MQGDVTEKCRILKFDLSFFRFDKKIVLMSVFSFPDEARISLVSEDHEDQLSSRGG